ncbi:polysaccharide deacetylase family protein [Lacrimispora sphenoides]|uniref:Polysaccharide deacetylase n=1 Tax=Lacrimispora sphenoides JCM 1415 TaxID=1297793 RepID=A0ABY1C3W0_9FIRM|nr:polysaccharide deacetylase family protein [Lacrimispora sphenoides]SET61906.1 Polysaccharide deacetylase [[Clostridium] sphenoides JCM 1415]SUY50095.1 polysaccharide deacetylase [Lacrimispora sphenoides]
MDRIIKDRSILKNIIIIIIFSLLSISIVKSIYRIYVVSSVQPADGILVPIIMYHQVKNSGFGNDVISPNEFESDLKYLKENHYNTITMTQLIEYVHDKKELPPNPVILSFDDGYLSTYLNVYPLVKEYNMKIVLSVIGKSVDDFSKVCDENIEYSHVTWDEIKEMQQSGLVEIQSHSYNLHKISKGRYGCCQLDNESLENYEEFLSNDLNKLQEEILSVTGSSPNTFTYPYGRYNDKIETIIKKLGFKATLTCKFGVNVIDNDPDTLYSLKRIRRAHNQSIQKMLKEGMETVKSNK